MNHPWMKRIKKFEKNVFSMRNQVSSTIAKNTQCEKEVHTPIIVIFLLVTIPSTP